MKTVLDGSPTGASLPAATIAFLEVNGGRLGHATRGFWRDGPGVPLSGVKEAERVATGSLGGGPWVFIAAPGSS
jgi:hypothetical protein